jgi:CRISPR-associated protein Csm2
MEKNQTDIQQPIQQQSEKLCSSLKKYKDEKKKIDDYFYHIKKEKDYEKKQKLEDDKKMAENYAKSQWHNVLSRIPLFIKGLEIEEMIEGAQCLGIRFNKEGLTTSQIRNFFGEVRRIQMNFMKSSSKTKSSIALLQPRLAYTAAKENKTGTKELSDTLTIGLKTIMASEESLREEYFENFANFFEAILAYHRADGGK